MRKIAGILLAIALAAGGCSMTTSSSCPGGNCSNNSHSVHDENPPPGAPA